MKNKKSNNPCHTSAQARSISGNNKEIFRSTQNDNRDSLAFLRKPKNDKTEETRNDAFSCHLKRSEVSTPPNCHSEGAIATAESKNQNANLLDSSLRASTSLKNDKEIVSPSLAEGDKVGGLKAQKISNTKFANNESTLPLTPSAREGGQVSDFRNDKSAKHYKSFAFCFAGSLGVVCVIRVLLGILLYLYDPFMLFHKPYFRAMTYHSDLRIAAKGIIDYTDFDSVVLGSSMIENTSAKEAGRKLGGKWVNISLAGSDFSERKVALGYAFKRKNIRQVIFSLDSYVLLNGDREKITPIDSALYANGNFLEKFKRYLDKKLIWCAIKWSKKGECVGDREDLESVAHSEHRRNERHFRGFAFWGEWQKNEVTKQYSAYLENDLRPQSKQTKRLDFEAQKAYLQDGVLEMIRQNPQMRFSLIYPPYPRFFYALFPLDDVYHKGRNGKEMFAETEKILKWLVAEVANLDNATIYGFDDLPYADEITNYCDRAHYYIDMNSMQLDAIANGTHILTPQNIDAYLQTMENKIKNYDIAPLIAQIQAWEASQK